MDEVGAETAEVRTFITRIDQGESWETALKELKVPGGITDFVSETLRCAIHGSVVGVAAYFFFGREDVIPEMFKKLLALWGEGAVEVPHFAFYLERHIELDGESHGPWAQEMLMALAGEDEKKWMEATNAARRAITSRIRLWDGVVAHLRNSPNAFAAGCEKVSPPAPSLIFLESARVVFRAKFSSVSLRHRQSHR